MEWYESAKGLSPAVLSELSSPESVHHLLPHNKVSQASSTSVKQHQRSKHNTSEGREGHESTSVGELAVSSSSRPRRAKAKGRSQAKGGGGKGKGGKREGRAAVGEVLNTWLQSGLPPPLPYNPTDVARVTQVRHGGDEKKTKRGEER